jgi:hypothetical protein
MGQKLAIFLRLTNYFEVTISKTIPEGVWMCVYTHLIGKKKYTSQHAGQKKL